MRKELNRIERLEETILRMANYIEKPKNKFAISKTFNVRITDRRFICRGIIFNFKIIEMYFRFENFEWYYICVDQNQNTTTFPESEILLNIPFYEEN